MVFLHTSIIRYFRKIAKNQLIASSCRSILLFVLTDKFGSQIIDSHEILCLNILRKPPYETEGLLESDKENMYVMWANAYLWHLTEQFLLREMFQKKFHRKSKYNFMFQNFIPPPPTPRKKWHFCNNVGKIWFIQTVHTRKHNAEKKRWNFHVGLLSQKYRQTHILFSTWCFSTAKIVRRTRRSAHCLSCLHSYKLHPFLSSALPRTIRWRYVFWRQSDKRYLRSSDTIGQGTLCHILTETDQEELSYLQKNAHHWTWVLTFWPRELFF